MWGMKMVEQNVEIKSVPPMKIAGLMARGMPFQKTVPEAFGKLMQWMAARGLPAVSGSPMGLAIYYDDPSSVASADVRFKVAMPVASETEPISDAGAAVEVLPECDVACITMSGAIRESGAGIFPPGCMGLSERIPRRRCTPRGLHEMR